MRTLRVPVTALFVLSLATVLMAQTPAPPKPGPEHQKLDYWVGTWNIESEMKPSPFGPGGKVTATDRVESLGGFFVVFQSDAKTPSGPMKSAGIMGYDAATKRYTFSGAGSDGSSTTGTGSVTGNTWTWTTESKMAGKGVKGRFTATTMSPTSYTFKFEIADDKGGYSAVEEGKATKK